MIQFCNLRILRSMCARAAKRLARLRSEEGATLMETAVTLPVFLGALAVGASVSLGLYNVQQLSNASSIAITAVAENRGLTADPCKLAVSSITATLPHWTAGNFTYTLTISYPTSYGYYKYRDLRPYDGERVYLPGRRGLPGGKLCGDAQSRLCVFMVTHCGIPLNGHDCSDGRNDVVLRRNDVVLKGERGQ